MEPADQPANHEGPASRRAAGVHHADNGLAAISAMPHLAIPKGGGAITSLGERFSVKAATGAASATVPLPVSACRGFEPKLTLEYGSGGGNGVFGLGWSVPLAAITRKTDRGIPRYRRQPGEEDVFLLLGSDDLVPALRNDGTPDHFQRNAIGTDYIVTRYRPRIEGSFSRIERWRRLHDGEVHWRTISRDNVTAVYGETSESRIVDPEAPDRIFSWLICRSWTTTGDLVCYDYAAEDDRAFADVAFERQRVQGAQRHLKHIRYGFDTPFDPELPVAPLRHHFDIVFDYGDHDPDNPQPVPDLAWPQRPDAFSSYRPGFEVRTHRLCRRMLMFHDFAELGPAPLLVRSATFNYLADTPNRSDEGRIASLLASVTIAGHIAGQKPEQLPAIAFSYAPAKLHTAAAVLDPASHRNLPGGIGDEARIVDLDGEGIAGLLSCAAEAWYYKRGAPVVDPDGLNASVPAFLSTERIERLPAGGELAPHRQLIDVSGEGRLAVAAFDGPVAGFFERRTDARGWQAFQPFARLPHDPKLGAARMLDVDGDGMTDLVLIDEDAVRWWSSLGRSGYGNAHSIPQRSARAERARPPVADLRELTLFADMTGDGLADHVRVRNGDVTYWPNLGHGKFSAPVRMRNAPRFDDEQRFDPNLVRVGDVDGAGPSDLLYLRVEGPRLYRNRSGNGFADAEVVPVELRADELHSATLTDLTGSGTASLVWSSRRPAEAERALHYVDLMGAAKPYLLVSVVNNLGAETRIRYRASTAYYSEDRAAGQPWLTRPHFPVHVVAEVENFDRVTQRKLTSRYRYRHGYYDGFEREFNGFAMVEQVDTQSLSRYSGRGLFTEEPACAGAEFHLPPVRTVTWYHNGALIGDADIAARLAGEYWQGDPQSRPLDPIPIAHTLGAVERREAARALKGAALRTEIYCDDGTAHAGTPYSVTETRARLRVVQPRVGDAHGVFLVESGEEMHCCYDRVADDPRISHSLTLATDRYGHPLRTASIAYPRRAEPNRVTAQERLIVMIEEQRVAHQDGLPDLLWLGVPVEARGWELHGLALPPAGRFTADALDGVFQGLTELAYEADSGGANGRRLIMHQRTYYRSDDLAGALPLGEIGSSAIVLQKLRKALTPGLAQAIYDSKLTPQLLAEGGYVGDGTEPGWIATGRQYYTPGPAAPAAELAAAKASFFQVRRVADAFGSSATIAFDPYCLLATEMVDALGNRTSARPHYRVLAHDLVTDPNGARTAARFDAAGLVTTTFRMGASGTGDGDVFDEMASEVSPADIPGVIIDHDLGAYARGEGPAVVRQRRRERHGDRGSPFQELYLYGDGAGAEVLRKVPAEPGPAPLRDGKGAFLRDGNGGLVIGQVADRWIGSGRVATDNKGNIVKAYDPFFDSSPAFVDEIDLVETGVTRIARFDPLGRLERVDHPDGRFSLSIFTPWSVTQWDENDTVLQSRWFTDRGAPAGPVPPGDPQGRAAWLARAHADTPAVNILGILGETAVARFDLGIDPLTGTHRILETVYDHDGEGRLVSVTDPLGRIVARSTYDMAARKIRHEAIDGEDSVEFHDITGEVIRSWTRRGFQARYEKDALRRPLRLWISGGTLPTEILSERHIYGEGHPAATALGLNGRLYRRYDKGGLHEQSRFDFKGGLLEGRVTQISAYREEIDWTVVATARADPALLDTLAGGMLRPETWSSACLYDGLDRKVQTVAPHAAGRAVSVVQPVFSRAGLMTSLNLWLGKAAAPGVLLDPSTATRAIVRSVDHDAHGRRLRALYGNDGEETYDYDPLSFRLARSRLQRGTAFPAEERIARDLVYAYDPVGNVTQVDDDAQQPVYFSNAVATARLLYEHDAIGRLVSAEGREHLGLAGGAPGPPTQPNYDDGNRHVPHKHDGRAVARYVENYTYDDAGNLLVMGHRGMSGSWTRRYAYNEASALEPAFHANKLTATSRPGEAAAGPFGDTYGYDVHGNMTRAPHLTMMAWDPSDMLRATSKQSVAPAIMPETTWYVGGPPDTRSTKVTDAAHASTAAPVRRREILYLGEIEIERDYAADGVTIVREVETLTVADNGPVVALVETRLVDVKKPVGLGLPLIRYRHDNLVGSVSLELDDGAQVISYEEYLPFGGTAMLIENAAVRAASKRYRYAGKERDDETGFYFFGARYYAPWLGRWISPDPDGVVDHLNGYVYVHNNPVTFQDPNGRISWSQGLAIAAVITVAVAVTVITAGAGAVAVTAAVGLAGGAGTAAGTAVGIGGAIVVAAGSGAAGSAAATAFNNHQTGSHDSVRDAALSGAVAGVVTLGVGAAIGAAGRAAVVASRAAQVAGTAGRAARAITTAARVAESSAVTRTAARAVAGAGLGTIAGGTQEATRQAVSGERDRQGGTDWSRVGTTAALGAAGGAVIGAASPLVNSAVARVSNAITRAGAGLRSSLQLSRAPRIAAEDSVPPGYARVYRAVSHAEFDNIVTTGRFNQGPNSLEGKWFADSYTDVLRHGDGLEGPRNYRVVQADLPDNAPSLYRVPNLDNRGPARFIHMDDLQSVTPKPYSPR